MKRLPVLALLVALLVAVMLAGCDYVTGASPTAAPPDYALLILTKSQLEQWPNQGLVNVATQQEASGLAGLDGVARDAEPPRCFDGDVYAAADLPHHVPTVDAALDACAGMWVNVEIKNWPDDVDFDIPLALGTPSELSLEPLPDPVVEPPPQSAPASDPYLGRVIAERYLVDRLLGVEGALLAGEALHDHLGVLVDKYAHALMLLTSPRRRLSAPRR